MFVITNEALVQPYKYDLLDLEDVHTRPQVGDQERLKTAEIDSTWRHILWPRSRDTSVQREQHAADPRASSPCQCPAQGLVGSLLLCRNPGNDKLSASTSAFSALCLVIFSFRVIFFVMNYDVKLCATSFVPLVPPAAANLQEAFRLQADADSSLERPEAGVTTNNSAEAGAVAGAGAGAGAGAVTEHCETCLKSQPLTTLKSDPAEI